MKSTKRYGRDFTLVVVGQIISLSGNAILRFSLPLYLLRATQSSSLFGTVTACSFLPMIILSLLGGVLADRVNKRNIMVCLDSATAIILIIFYWLMGTVPMIPLFIITLMLLYGIAGTYQPAVQASIPALVPKERILSANAVISQVGALANFTGPVIGGFLYGLWGITIILKVSILCFVLSALMETFLVIPFTKRPGQGSIWHIVKSDLRDSMHFLIREKPQFIQVCIVIAGLNLFLSSMITIGIPVIIVKTLSLPDQLLGITQGLLAVGGVIGGLMTVIFEKKLYPQKASVFLYLCSLFALFMGTGMLPDGLPLLKYIVLSGTGLCITVSSTIFSIQMLAIVQAQTPEHFIGKVIACIMTFIMCSQPIGQLLYGVLFELLSQKIAFLILSTGIISFLIALYSQKVLLKTGENTNENTEKQ